MSSQQQPFARVVARAWSDDEYRRRLLDDPRIVLEDAGLKLPDEVEIRILEDTDTTRHFVLPADTSDGEVSEEELERVAGGVASVYVDRHGGF